jgi:hypothetical protein
LDNTSTMPTPPTADIRETLLKVVDDLQKDPTQSSLQQGLVLKEAAKRLGCRRNAESELAILSLWSDLFRTGYLAWGFNLDNPNPPFFHITESGRRALERLSRDPGNPAGYLAHINSIANLNVVARSYLNEGLACFGAGLHKAAAVMLGAASESMILEIRDVLLARMNTVGLDVPKGLQDWRVKAINDALGKVLSAHLTCMPRDLRDKYEAFWPAFTQQIRSTRNDAGHPSSVDPVAPDSVHASFLVFPEVARTATELLEWIPNSLKCAV